MGRQRVKRNADGEIVGLCGDGWDTDKYTAIAEISADPYAYYVQEQVPPVFVTVGTRGGRKYFNTEPDITRLNNLERLPPC
jgi:hypothetical protein